MHANRALEGLLKARLAGGSSLVGGCCWACVRAVGCVGARERKYRATRSQLYVVFTAKPLRALEGAHFPLTLQNSRQLYEFETRKNARLTDLSARLCALSSFRRHP
jgi:hypothetical protein